RALDSYSVLYENDRATPTGLGGYLRERGFQRVFLAGLALDFCVRYSAEDAHREGFAVVVIANACRALDVAGSLAATHRSLAERSIACVEAQAIDGADG
ncbi:MAG TPA: isochorismatase family protein, partial [Nannocystis sp.]